MPKARREHGLRAIEGARKALAAQAAAGNDPRRNGAVNGTRGVVQAGGRAEARRVCDENGTVVETINGFEFSNVGAAVFESIHVNATRRTGYVNGPGANELQEFTY